MTVGSSSKALARAQTNPTRTTLEARRSGAARRLGVVGDSRKWSPREDGVLQIWKDGKLVLDRKGPNVYGTIGVDYTPYFKTGIYHPEWHLNDERKRAAFEKEKPVATRKIVYVTDIKVGGAKATIERCRPALHRTLIHDLLIPGWVHEWARTFAG